MRHPHDSELKQLVKGSTHVPQKGLKSLKDNLSFLSAWHTITGAAGGERTTCNEHGRGYISSRHIMMALHNLINTSAQRGALNTVQRQLQLHRLC